MLSPDLRWRDGFRLSRNCKLPVFGSRFSSFVVGLIGSMHVVCVCSLRACVIVKSLRSTESWGIILDRDWRSVFQTDMQRARADEDEAVIFLAEIIPKKAKAKIRKELEANPRLEGLGSISLGLTTRNALRAGGFFLPFPETMELIWVDWLRKAAALPEDKIILNDPITEKVKRYRASVRRPPLRPRLDLREVASIKERLETRHNVKLPEVEVRHSDNIQNAFSTNAVKLPRRISRERREKFERSRKSSLRLKGLKIEELKEVNLYKFTIFLPRRYANYPAGLHGVLWHEFGHALGHVLDVRDKTRGEGVAYACGFRGLLMEAMEGKFSIEKAVDEIENQIKGASSSLPFFPHHKSLRVIKTYNTNLNFRNGDRKELIDELDRSIQHAIEVDRELVKIVESANSLESRKPSF